jgi:hypothetical protein
MKHLKKYNESISDSDINELKSIISELPKMRWNISEDPGYWGDEWDNWQHTDEEELGEYFGKMFSTIKKIKDKIESL